MIITRTVAVIAALFIALLLGLSSSFAQNLAGTWIGNVTCRGQYVEPQPWPLTVNVAGTNGNYTVTAATPNAAGAGVIIGNRVTFTLQIFFNTAHFTGTVVGNRMSGSYVQGGAAAPCSWFAVAPQGVAMPMPKTAPPPLSKSAPPVAAPTIGAVGEIAGKVTITTQAGETIIAKSGTLFHSGDTVETGAAGKVQVMLKDQTVFSIGPNSKMVLDEFVYDPSSSASRLAAQLSKGFFRWVTSKIVQKPDVRLQVGSDGGIGIRGTEFEVEVRPDQSGYVKVFSGEVVYTAKKAQSIVSVKAGQILSFDQAGSLIGPQPFNP